MLIFYRLARQNTYCNLCCVYFVCSFRLFVVYPKAIVRIAIVIVNNIYCIPTYTLWMLLLLPLKRFNQKLYYKIEGKFFHWLLSVVAMWSWSAGYDGKLNQLFINIYVISFSTAVARFVDILFFPLTFGRMYPIINTYRLIVRL